MLLVEVDDAWLIPVQGRERVAVTGPCVRIALQRAPPVLVANTRSPDHLRRCGRWRSPVPVGPSSLASRGHDQCLMRGDNGIAMPPCDGSASAGRAVQTLTEDCPSFIVAHIRRCFRQSGTSAISRNCLSVTVSRPRSVAGRNRICSWMSGANLSKCMICVKRTRVTWPMRANSAWSATTPSRISPSSRIARAMSLAPRGTLPAGIQCADAHRRCRPDGGWHPMWRRPQAGSSRRVANGSWHPMWRRPQAGTHPPSLGPTSPSCPRPAA